MTMFFFRISRFGSKGSFSETRLPKVSMIFVFVGSSSRKPYGYTGETTSLPRRLGWDRTDGLVGIVPKDCVAVVNINIYTFTYIFRYIYITWLLFSIVRRIYIILIFKVPDRT